MPSCALRYCTNTTKNIGKNQGITFHQFPHPRHEKRESWIRFVQKNRSEETWLPTVHSRVCSVHFKENDKYISKGGRVFLLKSAVPCDNPTSCDEPELQDPLSDSESVSSSNSIFDTPLKILLKNKLREESAARKKLAEKAKKLQRQNIYLKKKCASYRKIIQNLKLKLGNNENAENNFLTKTEVFKETNI